LWPEKYIRGLTRALHMSQAIGFGAQKSLNSQRTGISCSEW
jgi:hypothetical protein